jgi:hypothetical protein
MSRTIGIAATCFAFFAVTLATLAGAKAQDLPMPTGDVILTVSGAIGARNAGDMAKFDLAMLEALPRHEIKTGTPWTDGTTTFQGFALKDLLALVKAGGETLHAVALNDYATDIPASDADRGVIIAYKVNGDYITVREKGPLWVIYPFDEQPDLKTETIYGRSIWQLTRLEVL